LQYNRIYITIIFVLISIITEAQYFNHNNSWKSKRHEYTIGGGVTNYIGDLGGLDKKGTNYTLVDIEFSQFKYGFYGSYRYNISHRHSSSISLFYGKIAGDDALTSEPFRNNRNLSFTNNIIELTWNYEYYIIRPQPGHIYDIQGAKGLASINWDFYVFLGMGAFYHNPKSNGTPLRFKGTEGQGLPGEKPYYNLIAFSFPVGFGGAYHISKSLKIGTEMAYRWTTTDYLDDVSGNYYDNAKIAEFRGAQVAALADPSSGENPSWTKEGTQRGDPKWKDGFLTLLVKVTYMPKKKKGQKNKQKLGGSNKGFAKGKTKKSGSKKWWIY
jgi:hypothetical protein